MTAPEIPDPPAGPAPQQTLVEACTAFSRAASDVVRQLVDVIAQFARTPLFRHWVRATTPTHWHLQQARVQLRREGVPHPTPDAVRQRAYDLRVNKHG